jgi:pyruvate dehydrogenase E2 component (dihydrolipoamide acetyltransferase)
MAIDVVMPQMGESIMEGTIIRWLKQPGDRVEKDEPLFEISTDKVDAEIPSTVAGILAEIRFPVGSTVTVNTVVAIIADIDSAPAAGAPVEKASKPLSAPAPAVPAPPTAASPVRAATPPMQTQPQNTAPRAFPSVPAAPSPASGRRIRSSPLVRRMAREHGIDLSGVPGSGASGRITRDDVQHYLSQPAGVQASVARPVRPAERPPLPNPADLPAEPVPLTRMRAIIAQRMSESMAISPHAHLVYRVDMTRIVRQRERERESFEGRYGVKLTYMPFVAAAAIEALRRFPIVNASLREGAIYYHRNIHLGIAVALEWGLIVPVVTSAETRGFADLARTMTDLAERARTRKLQPEEALGSTFTLTNSGVFGDEFGTPVINQPESAIMAIGSLRKEPVVVTDAEGNDAISIRSMQHFCLGFDHRLIDGADAGKFMADFKQTLESWDREIG